MVAVGFSPRTASKDTVRRRGATLESSDPTVPFSRRSATAAVCSGICRGLKPTATPTASLREAGTVVLCESPGRTGGFHR
jgi:hypothetical protein